MSAPAVDKQGKIKRQTSLFSHLPHFSVFLTVAAFFFMQSVLAVEMRVLTLEIIMEVEKSYSCIS